MSGHTATWSDVRDSMMRRREANTTLSTDLGSRRGGFSMRSCAEERKEQDKKESIAQQRLLEKEDTVLHFRKCFASPSY